MYRFKGFDSALCGDSLSALETIVNTWMDTEHPRIRHMCQSVRGEHILLCFVYEEMRELEEHVSTQRQSGALTRFFDDQYIEEHPTNPEVPATPSPMPMH